jgi:ATP-dependent helicase/nuclease subunit A
MALRYAIPKDTQDAQRKASDPKLTAWVSANAGSGKTHVLTQRVIRLLLEGVAPSRILCLTFTKAAAANMSLRVFDTLAKWTALDDAALEREICATGAEFSTDSLAFARRLFARTVETPGGLKIQTIHAFCERLLHLFPFEANVASHFRVIEEEEQAELLQQARDVSLTEAGQEPDSPLGKALSLVSRETNADDFNELMKAVLSKRDLLAQMVEANGGDLMRYEAQLRRSLGITSNRSAAEIEEAILEEGITDWQGVADGLKRGSANDKKLAAKFEVALSTKGVGRIDSYLSIWLTQKGTPLANIGTANIDPQLKQELEQEQARVIQAMEVLKSVECLERSSALVRLSDAIFKRYRALKQARGLLDFDDLITTVRRLLVETSPGWVLFKLDSGIDHILVDEAQDTSPAQWDILCRLSEEFMVGAGQCNIMRTFFAVGDEKQSIYSFQGADPRKFDEMRQYFARHARDAQMGFENVPLHRSFRSAPGILKCVDKVFADSLNRKGLSYGDDVAPQHQALKEKLPSVVEIWPRIEGRDEEQERDWRLPVDLQDQYAPATVLANRIASLIRGWLDPSSPERVCDEHEHARRIRAGDIMILVRRRNAFFEAIIRALKEKDVPVAGADRLQLLESIAVMDLIAAGRSALLPQDDLSLACVLKSPLIGR